MASTTLTSATLLDRVDEDPAVCETGDVEATRHAMGNHRGAFRLGDVGAVMRVRPCLLVVVM